MKILKGVPADYDLFVILLTETRLWLLLLLPPRVVLTCSCLAHIGVGWGGVLYHLYCQFACLIIRVNGMFMSADACAANSEPPAHIWSRESNSLPPKKPAFRSDLGHSACSCTLRVLISFVNVCPTHVGILGSLSDSLLLFQSSLRLFKHWLH